MAWILDDEESVFSRQTRTRAAVAPDTWDAWLQALFPRHVAAGFAHHHAEFWQWVWSIGEHDTPDPFIGIWARGGGKSTGAELGTVALGIRGKRNYVLYVRETQEQADKSVSNIAALLESNAVERYYPKHADRKLNKWGNSKGWRRERLTTAGGLTIDALGLDSASRGVKVEEQRPDLIVLDDIDDKHDSPATTAKKIQTITHSILPAGSANLAVLGIQNLITPNGFFTRMTDGRADYLTHRILSGPHPAIRGMEWEWVEDPDTGIREAVITAGEASWAGQSMDICQKTVNRIGISAFLKECQHDVLEQGRGLALRFDKARHTEPLTDEEARRLCALGQVYGGMDFGRWRFGFVLRAVDEHGRPHEIAHYFGQDEAEGLSYRAKVVHAICSFYGAPRSLRIMGDAANPTDVREINIHLQRLGSPYRVVAVAMENKARQTSVERINDLLARNAFFYRSNATEAVRNVLAVQWKLFGYKGAPPDTRRWRLNQNSASAGVEMTGSRLIWETEHWSYPVPKEGEAQRQDPDDNSADGADLIAADRYGTMSWWSTPRIEVPPPPVDRNEDQNFAKVLARLDNAPPHGLTRSKKLTRTGTLTRRPKL